MNEPSPLEARPSRRRVLALGALWLSIGGAALSSPGCYGRNCEGGVETYGSDGGEGRMLDENTWESAPMDGAWRFFARQHYYVFDIKALSGRTPQLVVPYLSAQLEPSKNNGNFTIGGGNLALFSNPAPNRIDIRNDTCSDYYLRLVVVAAPLPPTVNGGTAGVDAGADAAVDDGDAGDAGP